MTNTRKKPAINLALSVQVLTNSSRTSVLEKQMQEITDIKESLAIVESTMNDVRGDIGNSRDEIFNLNSGISDLNNRRTRIIINKTKPWRRGWRAWHWPRAW